MNKGTALGIHPLAVHSEGSLVSRPESRLVLGRWGLQRLASYGEDPLGVLWGRVADDRRGVHP